MEVCSNWRFGKLILKPRNRMSYAIRSSNELESRTWKSESRTWKSEELLESRKEGSMMVMYVKKKGQQI